MIVNDTLVADFLGGTSASFTPAANSLLVLCVALNSNGSAPSLTPSGGGLTWTQQVLTSSTDGRVFIYTAPVGSSPSSMTVALENTGGTGFSWAKIYEVSGYYTSSPIGNSAVINNGTGNDTVTSLTTAGKGRVFGVGLDWNELGTPTSTDVYVSGIASGECAYIAAYTSSNHARAGLTGSIDTDAGGSATARWQTAILEIREPIFSYTVVPPTLRTTLID